VSEQGVVFRSHIDGATVELSPERAIEIQLLLGSDIAMQLDECVRLPATQAEIERAMQLSLRWAERSKRAFEGAPAGHMLFGIVQGGDVPSLRQQSAKALIDIGFPGYAIGGLAVGEPQETMLKMIEEVAPLLPTDRPRYLMGVGTPDDMVKSVARGIDMFDCVMPTRNGRHGTAFTRFGAINLANARHADDPRPLAADLPDLPRHCHRRGSFRVARRVCAASLVVRNLRLRFRHRGQDRLPLALHLVIPGRERASRLRE
jgi:queuine tRNA-ribosyltransferase